MPAPQAKRVKGTQVERCFLIGSEARKMDPNTRKPNIPAEHTHEWKVYIRQPEGHPDINTWLKKVRFKLHHSIDNPVRTVEGPTPEFSCTSTGWGGFLVEINLYFQPASSEKSNRTQHYLQLEPFGPEEQQARQIKENLVRSEQLETIEFNEPTVEFYGMLISDEQWNYMSPKARGKGGKGGKGYQVGGVDLPHSAELIPRKTPNMEYSQQLEQEIIEVIDRAAKEADQEAAELEKRLEEVRVRKADLAGTV